MQEDVRTPASAFLRSATRRDHQMVDRQFGALSIDSPAGYRAFLVAHARILPLAERHLDPGGLLPGWQGRTHALHSDLAELAVARPVELECVLPEGQAARWGGIYVLEGSRLGGAFLSRQVAEGLPKAYLSAIHGAGQWKAIQKAIDDHDTGEAWRAEALAGAKALFAAFAKAAGDN